jgi:Dyp-type peroxidase family
MRNNKFDFDPPGLNTASNFPHTKGSRLICPIGAHIRKTHPRGDQPPAGRPSVDAHRILRRGIPYGPEISENANADRGLLFACYQSDFSQGFTFIQQFWANNTTFRFEGAGLDAVMGQTNDVDDVEMLGLKPWDASSGLKVKGVNRFVVPRGGEYFFSPSLGALKGVLSEVKEGQKKDL